MKKLRVTLTSLGVAAGILVGGYTIVNRLPVNGLSVGNPITNDDIKTYSVTYTTYDTFGGEPTVTERYESIKGINNRIKYDSYTPTHKTTNSDGNDKYFRQHTTFTLDDLTDDHYTFDESTISLIGKKNKRGYHLGDNVNVIVKSANKEARTVDFVLDTEQNRKMYVRS